MDYFDDGKFISWHDCLRDSGIKKRPIETLYRSTVCNHASLSPRMELNRLCTSFGSQ